MASESLEVGNVVRIKNWPTKNLVVGITDDRVRIYWRSKSGKTEGFQNVMEASVVEVLEGDVKLGQSFAEFVEALNVGLVDIFV